ncbi:multifunctional transcriptional regulator/nicotinamide-nucleotide adenylyltransferase/ribosylnicotinamide kinase NadR [Bacillus infantis]|uniref:Multifunctional transcriptional regulator/nicotinamide-nucleotide adenylyltransferase/ribosylnicotinamide kinase NadR n=1 Tax=Bacillus infantis TaxID=324767 RepID=A0A5D4SVD4_9BACI|nr:multifunctional transcriptional regulator/nicotinamide-nucleotide adenylyltransferase/ribosylnicotinamide kinase NadR [Bacillus infantis]MCP1159510.1 multifunctional transcriptional regulator/nicotinamide-nucleotide adenylyltransferase/ribosylnicotinamide kinase NadR [Bacillus infantis]TYS66621.1 multifunctional transcriptional regulator/nicotinamide-nucleotide adenylyltransferase/ribosylnicotinamide kinase NadR [Bacillus infantis]
MKKKTIGMYGGKFLPFPHLGHVYSMTAAAATADELHVIISHDSDYERKLFEGGCAEHVSFTLRLRWWKQLTRELPHVHVHEIYDEQTGSFSDWENGAKKIRAKIGSPIDFVFSSEPDYGPIFSRLYPEAEHILIDPERKRYPVSGTMFRKDGVLKHWDMVPKCVRPHFVKKVVIAGTESCGKSTLTANMAQIYNTSFVKEYGRTFYEELGGCEGITVPEDYPHIAYAHKLEEWKQLKLADKILFVDTEAITTQFFSHAYLNKRQPVLDEMARLQEYDLWLLLEPDVDWVDDGTRSFGHQDLRWKNHLLLKSLLDEHHVCYKIINGSYRERLEKSIKFTDELLEGK